MLLHYLVKVKTPKNVIFGLQRDITKENCIRCIIASSKWTRVIMCLIHVGLLIWGVIQQSVHETKIHDINDLQKRLVQTCFDFHRNVINAGVTIWNQCACWWLTLWTHALTWMFIYMIHQNILWNCRCNLMHVTAIL